MNVINPFLRSVLIGITLVFFVFITFMIRRKNLALKDTLTWFCASIVLIALAVFDGIAKPFARLLHIQEPVNALFLAVFFFVLLILFTLTATVSKATDDNRILTQELALLRKELEEARAVPPNGKNPETKSTVPKRPLQGEASSSLSSSDNPQTENIAPKSSFEEGQ